MFPESTEAAQLALEVTGRLSEALQASGLPVDAVQLDQRIDQLLAELLALRCVVEDRWQLCADHFAIDVFHDEERRADDRLVIADGEHLRHARGGRPKRSDHARFAQHVVGARG